MDQSELKTIVEDLKSRLKRGPNFVAPNKAESKSLSQYAKDLEHYDMNVNGWKKSIRILIAYAEQYLPEGKEIIN